MNKLPKPMPSWIGLQKCSEVSLTTKVRLPKNFFYNSLKQNPVLVGKQFDSVFRNVVGSTQESHEEYDILLFNVDSALSSRSSTEYTPRTSKHSSNARAATSHYCSHSIEIFNFTSDWRTSPLKTLCCRRLSIGE